MLLVLARNSNVAKTLYQIALCYISKDVWLFLPSGTFFQHLKIGNKVFHREEDILSFFEKKKNSSAKLARFHTQTHSSATLSLTPVLW